MRNTQSKLPQPGQRETQAIWFKTLCFSFFTAFCAGLTVVFSLPLFLYGLLFGAVGGVVLFIFHNNSPDGWLLEVVLTVLLWAVEVLSPLLVGVWALLRAEHSFEALREISPKTRWPVLVVPVLLGCVVSGFFIGPCMLMSALRKDEPSAQQVHAPPRKMFKWPQKQKPQEPPKIACESANVLKGAQVTASSTYTHTMPEYNFSAARIVDGDRSTELSGLHSWTNAEGTSNPQTVTLRFTPAVIKQFVLYTTKPYPIRDYDIEVREGDRWEQVASVRDNTGTIIQTRIEPRTAEEIRVVALSGPVGGPIGQGSYVRINELEAYGCD